MTTPRAGGHTCGMSPPPEGPQPERPAAEPEPEETKPRLPRPARPDRTLLAIMVAIAVMVIVALAVVLTRGEPAPLAESTPAGVVQRYAAAVIAGDEASASAYLTPAARNNV